MFTTARFDHLIDRDDILFRLTDASSNSKLVDFGFIQTNRDPDEKTEQWTAGDHEEFWWEMRFDDPGNLPEIVTKHVDDGKPPFEPLPDGSPLISSTSDLIWAIYDIRRRLDTGAASVDLWVLYKPASAKYQPDRITQADNLNLPPAFAFNAADYLSTCGEWVDSRTLHRATSRSEVLWSAQIPRAYVIGRLVWTKEAPGLTLPSYFYVRTAFANATWFGRLRGHSELSIHQFKHLLNSSRQRAEQDSR